MTNPLRKRLPRDLRSDFGKYLVIFLLMVISIGEVSGFDVADSSMIRAYQESFEKYNIEDGNFLISNKASAGQIRSIEEAGVTLYPNFYRELVLDNGSTLRIFAHRSEVNKACLMEGSFPRQAGQIALDRMFADNNGISVGDRISSGSRSFKVTGLIALSDYSALFQNNGDTMFDSVRFGVAEVSQEEFASYSKKYLKFCYSWKYQKSPSSEEEERDMAEDFMEKANDEVRLEAFTPRFENQSITFTGEDMGSDKAMMQAFLYIIIVIIAFVFGVTINNTIQKEAEVIGTLRATGYSKNELIRHYMAMPLLVTLVSALLGNVLGYTLLKDFNAYLYYNSYSLPTYVTRWSPGAFISTTLIPVVLMILITYLSLKRKLSLSPLKFLRRDLRKTSRGRALPLSRHIPFFTRFRLRIILQNIPNYMILFVGIIFANLLLMFGLIFPSIMDHYQATIKENMLCPYQYILQIPMDAMDEDHRFSSFLNLLYFSAEASSRNEDAEKFSAYTLKTMEKKGTRSEEILLYGIKRKSSYISLPTDLTDTEDGTEIFISSAYADKYRLKAGDRITLREPYDKDTYNFRVRGIYDYQCGLTIFMDQEVLNRTFDLDPDYFSGYLSSSEIKDIPQKYISTVIDEESLTKVSRQLMVSMGSMMNLVCAFSVIIFMILIYVLSKTIIEKNAHSISMTKVLGYRGGEISRLYILASFLIVMIFILISLPLETAAMKAIFRIVMMTSISGWIPFYLDPLIYRQMTALGIGTYALVAILEYLKILKIPMEEALKETS